MVFSSLVFLFRFLPIVLLTYFLSPRRLRNAVLLIESLVFYAWGEPKYMLLMLSVIAVSYAGGLCIAAFRRRGRTSAANAALFLSCVAVLSLLAFFKYADFALSTLNALGGSFALLNLALPVGISFYSFQSISYLADVWRGRADAEKNPIAYGAYIALFPQLIAGPIVRYSTVAVQLHERRETMQKTAEGIRRFIIGLSKKVLFANNAGLLWEAVRNQGTEGIPALTAWLALAAFSFQIYFDFSGYSDMAIGLGKIFGFEFGENFDHPYMARSVTDFWRRWHISLGAWFREYVYIPLGGNRVKPLRHIVNILLVWLLTGLWHGASWNFVLWGLYYAALLLVEKYTLRRALDRLPSALRHALCLVAVALGWVLFACDGAGEAFAYMRSLFGLRGVGAADSGTVFLLCNNAVLLALCAVASTDIPARFSAQFRDRHETVAHILQPLFLSASFVLCVAYLVDSSYNPFLYFRF